MKTNTVIQFKNLEVDEKSLITTIKEQWANQGNKIKDIKELQLYIKPEEHTAYYVINVTETGVIRL